MSRILEFRRPGQFSFLEKIISRVVWQCLTKMFLFLAHWIDLFISPFTFICFLKGSTFLQQGLLRGSIIPTATALWPLLRLLYINGLGNCRVVRRGARYCCSTCTLCQLRSLKNGYLHHGQYECEPFRKGGQLFYMNPRTIALCLSTTAEQCSVNLLERTVWQLGS